MRPRHALPLLFALAASFASCVTEETRRPSRGVPLHRDPAAAAQAPASRTTSRPPAPGAAPITLPDGPIASPATAAQVTDSRVIIAVRPIGRIPFDGLVLPLVSPDGRFIATQTGQAPEWPVLLASPDAAAQIAVTVERYDITAAPSRLADAEPLPPLLLGRAADNAGVLVESPQAGGARWIGRLDWNSGRLDWLVQENSVNAFATLSPAGDIAFCRAPVGDPNFALVLRTAQGAERTLATPGTSYFFPTLSPDRAILYAFAATRDGTEVIAVNTGITGQQPLDPSKLPGILARRRISRGFDPIISYQAVSPIQQAWTAAPIGTQSSEPSPASVPPTFLFYNPGMGRLCIFDPATSAVVPLVERSIAGVAYTATPVHSYFLTTPRGLVHQRIITREGNPTPLPEARVIADAFVPRATTNPLSPFILIGPGPRSEPTALQLVAMGIAGEEDAEAAKKSAEKAPKR